VRSHVVCDESDVVHEASQRSRAPPCDSVREGPFCARLLAERPELARRQRMPMVVDGVTPWNLFPELARVDLAKEAAVLERRPGSQVTAKGAVKTQKAVIETLNFFMGHWPRVGPKGETLSTQVHGRAPASEGRVDFGRVPIRRSTVLPRTFSRGLPAGVLASWDGAWQVDAAPGPRRSAACARLNGALGHLRFSRPVVLRSLAVRPPLQAAEGHHRLTVRARLHGREVWRSTYDFDAEAGPAPARACSPGDVVKARWAGDGRVAGAVVLSAHRGVAVVRWRDDDHTHRVVPWRSMTTTDGSPCPLPEEPWPRAGPGAGAAAAGAAQAWWRDLARRTMHVDEVSFLVPHGDNGWLLGDVQVAATRWLPDEATSSPEADSTTYVVQVLPGSFTVISEVSLAAVVYHADEMLDLGLELRQKGPGERGRAGGTEPGGAAAPAGHASASRSVEGVHQVLRALMDPGGGPPLRLPPHLQPDELLADVERLVKSLDVAGLEEEAASSTEQTEDPVKRYGHFEALFTYNWDWQVRVDALELTYESWRRSAAAQREAQGAFFEGQRWAGSYLCTQGPTQLRLEVTSVTSVEGQDVVRADMEFKFQNDNLDVIRGLYEVAGRVELQGRSLVLEPAAWKQRPKKNPNSFIMVGLQGVVSRTEAAGELRFAGSVPSFGCDSFELRSRARPEAEDEDAACPAGAAEPGACGPQDEAAAPAPEETSKVAPMDHRTVAWNSALARLSQALARARRGWQRRLAELTQQADEKSEAGAASHVSIASAAVAALAKAGGGR
ncbi:unnamed protein product, partial [Prorocentrum cordatum]